MTFDAQLAATTAEDFIERILVGRFGIGGAAIGFDFHFGNKRAGSPAYLAEQGARLGFAVDIVPPLEDEGRPVSSGAVRTALAQGKVVEAAELLGAPWFVSGEVIHGAKRGRALGFPTANISSIRPAASSTASMPCAPASPASATTGWRISASARCSTAARHSWRCSCSTSTATSTGRRSTSPSSAGYATSRNSFGRDAPAPHIGGRRPGARRAQARRQGLSGVGEI